MFYHCYFLQKRPQSSSADRDKLLLLSLLGVSQKRGQILLLSGTINPLISSARYKQTTIASGHLHLIIPDDRILDRVCILVQEQEISEPRAGGGGMSIAPRCLHPAPALVAGSWWEPCSRWLFKHQFQHTESQILYMLTATSQDRFGTALVWGQGMGTAQRSVAAPRGGSHISSCSEG